MIKIPLLHSRRLAGIVLALSIPAMVYSQGSPLPKTNRVKLEAVAETHLLMEGLLEANFRGLNRLLKEAPPDQATWTFARGQALLIAESGNLLLIRPPKGGGQDLWQTRSVELRETGAKVARLIAAKDYARSRNSLVELANACNRCHRDFRVGKQINPWTDE